MLDYKKIIRSRRFRLFLLNILRFIPDRIMIPVQYKIKTGRWLNLKNPQRFTEKVQWYKLFYRNPLMKKCVDKYDVREYIEFIGLKSILNECYGVFDNVEKVDFEKLPEKFVMKDTLGGGGLSVVVCKSKSAASLNEYKNIIRKWLKTYTKKSFGREWVYEKRKHRVIFEKYIESDESEGGLIDYKFLCFHGKVHYVFVLADRIIGVGAGCALFDAAFNKLSCNELDEKPLNREIKKPEKYNEMVEIAEKISKEFPMVRVDLYNQNGVITFGEMTFFDSSGYQLFDPDEFDFELGREFDVLKMR